MRVLVCGGRDYADAVKLAEVLSKMHSELSFSLVIHGAYRGADRLADDWAENMGIDRLPFRAEWTKYGRGAGPRRNQKMLDEGRPDMVIAFPGDTGTADMVRRAKSAGVPVKVIDD